MALERLVVKSLVIRNQGGWLMYYSLENAEDVLRLVICFSSMEESKIYKKVHFA